MSTEKPIPKGFSNRKPNSGDNSKNFKKTEKPEVKDERSYKEKALAALPAQHQFLINQIKRTAFNEKENVDKCLKLITNNKDIFAQIILKRDISLAVQSLIKNSSVEQRVIIHDLLKPLYPSLVISTYGYHLITKILFYATPVIINEIVDIFISLNKKEIGKKSKRGPLITQCFRYPGAAKVIDDLFSIYATNIQRRKMMRPFVGEEFNALLNEGGASKELDTVVIKAGEVVSAGVKEMCNLFPLKQERMIMQLGEVITSFISKEGSVDKNELIHCLIYEYLCLMQLPSLQALLANPTSALSLLVPLIPKFFHTQAGSRAAIIILSASTPKDRKKIVKAVKPVVRDVMVGDSNAKGGKALGSRRTGGDAWMFIARLTDVLDDTVLVKGLLSEIFKSEENIIKPEVVETDSTTVEADKKTKTKKKNNEVKSNTKSQLYFQDKESIWSFLYITSSPDDLSRRFPPSILNPIQVGSEFVKTTSKKDPLLRKSELRSGLIPSLVDALVKPLSENIHTSLDGERSNEPTNEMEKIMTGSLNGCMLIGDCLKWEIENSNGESKIWTALEESFSKGMDVNLWVQDMKMNVSTNGKRCLDENESEENESKKIKTESTGVKLSKKSSAKVQVPRHAFFCSFIFRLIIRILSFETFEKAATLKSRIVETLTSFSKRYFEFLDLVLTKDNSLANETIRQLMQPMSMFLKAGELGWLNNVSDLLKHIENGVNTWNLSVDNSKVPVKFMEVMKGKK